MAYNELSLTGSDEDLGDLEAKYVRPDYSSQIPGQVSISKSEAPKSLRERAVSALVQANPLMVGRSLVDTTKSFIGSSVLPVVAPISAGVQALNAAPGNIYRRSRGEEEVTTPTAEELMQKYGQALAPKTEMGKGFIGGVGKLMDTLKVPAAFPVVPNAPRRPMLTPTDVRVGAGQVKQLAKELRETPADFQAAQSGLKRQNLYGEDTIGVKAQAAADALGDTLERRKSTGQSLVPGLPEALTPETKLYAVRPKGSRIVQAQVPATAKGFRTDNETINTLVEDIYGDVPAANMPPAMVFEEYNRRFIQNNPPLREALIAAERQKANEMFPDAPTEPSAQRAYSVLYSDQPKRHEAFLGLLEDLLNSPEGEAFREQGVIGPKEFMSRMTEAERVLKGPFSNYINKTVGAEGSPTVKLARQGITYEHPEDISQLAEFANPTELADRRLASGFPAMGSFYEERLAKTGELDRLNEEIKVLEDARAPLFNRAHEEGIDPASIPEYAEATNPLRQKLRQREQVLGELENIKLGTAMENVEDSIVRPMTKKSMLKSLPYEQQQFFPSVTKAAEDEKLFRIDRDSLLKDVGYKKLGAALLEDILTGKAGDTSKLTIENYMREKGLSRIEAEKAAKVQEQKYRQTLQTTLLDRLRNDQSVKTFGNASIITLDQNTPRDVAIRDMSADTTVLDHCVGQCGTAPQGRKNILTGRQQYYEPLVDPITGERSGRGNNETSYVRDLERGHELISVRDSSTGLPAATIQLIPTSGGSELRDGTFDIGYASGAKNEAVDPAYTNAIRDYLNQRSGSIRSAGDRLADHTGVFDASNPGDWRRVTKEAGLTKDQAAAFDFEAGEGLPRFVTVDDVKAATKDVREASRALVAQDQGPVATLTATDHARMLDDFNSAWSNAIEGTRENSNLDNPARVEGAMNRAVLTIFQQHLEDPVAFTQEGVTRLRRAERDMQNVIESSYAQNREVDTELANGLSDLLTDVRGIRSSIERRLSAAENNRVQPEENLPVGDWEPDAGHAANNPGLLQAADRFSLALRYDVPPVTAEEILTYRHMPIESLAEFRDQARQGIEGTIFETLSDESRLGAYRMLTDMIDERTVGENYNRLRNSMLTDVQLGLLDPELIDLNMVVESIRGQQPRNSPLIDVGNAERQMLADYVQRHGWEPEFNLPGGLLGRQSARQLPAPVAPAQQAPQLAQRVAVPREIQDMSRQDLITSMEPRGIRQAEELATMYFDENIIDENNTTISALTNMIRNYNVGLHAMTNFDVRELTARKLEEMNSTTVQDADQIARALHDTFYDEADSQEEAMRLVARDIADLELRGDLIWEDLIGPMAEDIPWSRNIQSRLLDNLRVIADGIREQDGNNPPRRGPFRAAGASAVRGLPLGNLNIRPAIGIEALRGPDSQPIRNFLQQVKGLPGVTQEGLTTGLMAFENMDPNRRITKAEFVRELLPSSYEVVDLKNAATDNQQIREIVEEDIIDDQSPIGYLLGLTDAQVDMWSDALAEHSTDFDQYPAKLKRALAKKGIKDADQYNAAYDKAYQAAIQQGIDGYYNDNQVEESQDGYMYGETQRLTITSMGDEYGEFGVTHPDQRGAYKHYDNAPEGTIGHFRGTYNPSDPLELKTASDKVLITKPGSYVIEEIQSDVQKGIKQKAHLHQVHGILFKSAIQKALEFGADTVYLPSAAVIAVERQKSSNKFAPIYDQAIVKEGLKPLLKIPGVKSKMVDGYHEITFTPKAIEHILNGPGQTIPGYAKGGIVKKARTSSVVTRRHPELAEMQYQYGGMV